MLKLLIYQMVKVAVVFGFIIAVIACGGGGDGGGGDNSESSDSALVCGGLNVELDSRWVRVEGTTASLPDWFKLNAVGSTGGLYSQPDFAANEFLEYSLSVECDAILLIDGNGYLYRTWGIALSGDSLHVVGPWQRESTYARHNQVDEPLLAINLEREELWADGFENVEVRVSARASNGLPLAGVEVSMESILDNGVDVEPLFSQVTDEAGTAMFLVRSNRTGALPLRASLVNVPEITREVVVTGVRRRVVVLVQGISTELLDELPFPDLRVEIAVQNFVRPRRGIAEPEAVWEDGIDNDDDGVIDDGGPLILDFSYQGGLVLPMTGRWLPNPYSCWDTGQSIETSMDHLHSLLNDYATAHTNTVLSVVGHSQGGLVALQSLNLVVSTPITAGGAALESVVTLDGALGGNPNPGLTITEWFQCWGNDAAQDLLITWNTASDNDAQGSTAISFGNMVHRDLVSLAAAREVRTMTLGSYNDCVFSPIDCGTPFLTNLSSQVIDTATWRYFMLGGNCGGIGFIKCIKDSHSMILSTPSVVTAVVDFLGAATLP
ncbi:MAG: hypothetical protein GY874_13820 [Desulfobacteraceae bacterium]|nr:hypothetical protein [Desulfobacteraceae bacterium]